MVVTDLPQQDAIPARNQTGSHELSFPDNRSRTKLACQHDLKMKSYPRSRVSCFPYTKNVSPPHERLGASMYTELPHQESHQQVNLPDNYAHKIYSSYQGVGNNTSPEQGGYKEHVAQTSPNFGVHNYYPIHTSPNQASINSRNSPSQPYAIESGGLDSHHISPSYNPGSRYESCSQSKSGFTPEPLRMNSEAGISPEAASYPGLSISAIPDVSFIDIPDIRLSLTSFPAIQTEHPAIVY